MKKIRFILGFLAAKLGMSYSSFDGKEYGEGWFVGTGIKEKHFQCKPFRILSVEFGFIATTRKRYKFTIRKNSITARYFAFVWRRIDKKK